MEKKAPSTQEYKCRCIEHHGATPARGNSRGRAAGGYHEHLSRWLAGLCGRRRRTGTCAHGEPKKHRAIDGSRSVGSRT
jgi:hypothetical protein